MGEVLKLIHAEFYKMRHTIFFWLHLLIPLSGIVLFLSYYKVSPHRWESELSGYITVLTVVLPFVISIVCGASAAPEEGSHFLAFLGAAKKKSYVFFAKWAFVFLMGLGAMALAVGGFLAGFCLILKRYFFDFRLCGTVILLMWLSSMGMYALHMFLNLWKPKSISLCVGTVETVVSALFLTGLGDGIWQFFPCAYGGHWEGHFFRYYLEGKSFLSGKALFPILVINGAVTAGILILTFAGFYFYEGRRTND